MAGSQIKTKTAYYKRAVIKGDKKLGGLLQKAFIDVTAKYKNPSLRHFHPNVSSEDFYVLNEAAMFKNMFYGELMYVEKDKRQTILKVEKDVSIYKQRQVTVDDFSHKDFIGHDKEFVENTLYFGVFENHVVVIQSTSLKINRLSDYLNYILGESKTDLLGDSIILFQDKPSEEAKKILAKTPAKTVKVSQQILATPVGNNSSESVLGFKSAGFTFDSKQSGLWTSIAKHFKLDKQAASKLKDTLEDESIYVDVVLRRKRGGNKTLSESGQDLMNTIATSFANLADEDFEIGLQGGGKLTAKDYRLSDKIKLEAFNNGINSERLKKDFFDFLEKNITDS